MSATKLNAIQFDATDLYCPEFSLPVRKFLSSIAETELAHIITKERRSIARIKHICVSYGWQYKCVDKNGLIHFLVSKAGDLA
jgi:TusA-related sulfurtransferase